MTDETANEEMNPGAPLTGNQAVILATATAREIIRALAPSDTAIREHEIHDRLAAVLLDGSHQAPEGDGGL